MSRNIEKFKRKQVIPYMMIGENSIMDSYQQLALYVQEGCEIIEIGVPFSDPTADGQIIQNAASKALKNDISIKDCVDFIDYGKKKYPNINFVLMTYLNPVLQYGVKELLNHKNISGIIIPDLPLEEYDLISKNNIVPLIPLIPIGTSTYRIQQMISKTKDFIYLVSVRGITGKKSADYHALTKTLTDIRANTDRPVASGFGIKSKNQVEEILEMTDGVIIGSQLIKLNNETNIEEIKKLLS